MLRRMLAVGPFPWRELGLRADEWPDCMVTDSAGEADAARLLRRSAFDVILTSPRAPVSRDLAIIHEAREQQPGIRAVMLAPALAPDDIIQAMRTEVFACFATPVSSDELRAAIINALDANQWKNGIEVVSALPHWITLRVACRRVNADRLTMFINELAHGIPKVDREDLSTAFREVLLNAMEHGAAFNPSKVIEVAAVRTERAIVYYFKDPGPGFNPKDPGSVATEDDPISHLADRESRGLRAGGFGMMLASRLVDEVHYNERGNEVFLVKHLDTHA